MKPITFYVARCVASGVALGVLASCGGSAGSDAEEASAPRHSVVVTHPTAADGGSTSTALPGVVAEQHMANIGFKTAGQITRIHVKEGDAVKAGQLLATLDDSDYRLGVEALEIQCNQVRDEVARARRLFDKNSLSANDYEKAEAGLRQLEVQLRVNRNKLAYTRLHAPVSGVITSVNFSPGEMVDAGTAMFGLMSASQLEVECDIPAALYKRLGTVGAITCTPSAAPEEVYPLRVKSVVPKADGNQMYRLTLTFANGVPSGITSGTNVSVTVGASAAGSKEGVRLTLPVSAIFRDGREVCVWKVMPDSTVTKQRVEVAAAPGGGEVTVSAGLSGGETIVRAGVGALHQGDRVKVIKPASETNPGNLL